MCMHGQHSQAESGDVKYMMTKTIQKYTHAGDISTQLAEWKWTELIFMRMPYMI